MIAYATIGANDIKVSAAFYDAALAPFGVSRFHSGEDFVGYADSARTCKLWLCKPFDQQAARAGNGIMIGFHAETRAQVDAFYAAALAHGGTDEGPPGLRDYGPTTYLAYVRDPVGNKISAFCTAPS